MISKIDAALERLSALHPKLIDLGLDRTFEILEALGNPHYHLPPTIHLAGTNGKGSTAAFLRAMAEQAGLSVHVYSSPHLCRFHERIRLAGTLIDDETLISLLEEVETANAGRPITFYEVTTAAAFLAFSRTPADLLILETGLGGELDSTNVLDAPAATILTPIDRDHEQFLGSDLGEIARTKSGIMRSSTPCISAQQQPIVADMIAKCAQDLNVPLTIVSQPQSGTATAAFRLKLGEEIYDCPKPSLFGAHQTQNAALAITALYEAQRHGKLTINIDAAIAGIAMAHWPGRIQHLQTGLLAKQVPAGEFWLDGAHNAHGAAALVDSLQSLSDGKWSLIVGLLNTRPPQAFFTQLQTIAAEIHAISIPDQPASLSAEEIAEAARSIGLKATPHPNLDTALKNLSNKNPVAICGSLYLAGYVLGKNGTLPE